MQTFHVPPVDCLFFPHNASAPRFAVPLRAIVWVFLKKKMAAAGCSGARMNTRTQLTNLKAPSTSLRAAELRMNATYGFEIGFIVIYLCSLRRGSYDLTRRRTLIASVTDLATYPCSLHQPSRRSVADPSQIPSPMPAIHPMLHYALVQGFLPPLSLKSLVFLNELIIFFSPLSLG
jgi:hypothetical protein